MWSPFVAWLVNKLDKGLLVVDILSSGFEEKTDFLATSLTDEIVDEENRLLFARADLTGSGGPALNPLNPLKPLNTLGAGWESVESEAVESALVKEPKTLFKTFTFL